MIKTTAMLHDELRSYRYPANKIARMVERGNLFPIVRGLYETDRDTPGYFLAASIYGPSYLSFEYALFYWDLIPEAVHTFTSATFDKKKKKAFATPFGFFTYRDVPKTAYPFGIQIVNVKDYSFLIAEPEKALCDQLYTLSPVSSQQELSPLLFENLRLNEADFKNLNKRKLEAYSELYQTTNHKLFSKWLRRTKLFSNKSQSN